MSPLRQWAPGVVYDRLGDRLQLSVDPLEPAAPVNELPIGFAIELRLDGDAFRPLAEWPYFDPDDDDPLIDYGTVGDGGFIAEVAWWGPDPIDQPLLPEDGFRPGRADGNRLVFDFDFDVPGSYRIRIAVTGVKRMLLPGETGAPSLRTLNRGIEFDFEVTEASAPLRPELWLAERVGSMTQYVTRTNFVRFDAAGAQADSTADPLVANLVRRPSFMTGGITFDHRLIGPDPSSGELFVLGVTGAGGSSAPALYRFQRDGRTIEVPLDHPPVQPTAITVVGDEVWIGDSSGLSAYSLNGIRRARWDGFIVMALDALADGQGAWAAVRTSTTGEFVVVGPSGSRVTVPGIMPVPGLAQLVALDNGDAIVHGVVSGASVIARVGTGGVVGATPDGGQLLDLAANRVSGEVVAVITHPQQRRGFLARFDAGLNPIGNWQDPRTFFPGITSITSATVVAATGDVWISGITSVPNPQPPPDFVPGGGMGRIQPDGHYLASARRPRPLNMVRAVR